jgi:DNA-binding NarL/FixJ family response regulator
MEIIEGTRGEVGAQLGTSEQEAGRMQSARRVLIVTRDKKLAAALESALRTTRYAVGGVCSSAIFNRRKAEMQNADMILLGARELIAEARRARSIGRRLATANPPVIVVLRDDQLLHGLSVMAPGQRLIFIHHLNRNLPQVIDLSLEGLIVIPDRVLQHIRSDALRVDSLGSLTAEEASVLSLLGQGAPNSRIAAHLGLPLSRAKSVVRSIISKLGMPNRTAVAVFYCQKQSLQ